MDTVSLMVAAIHAGLDGNVLTIPESRDAIKADLGNESSLQAQVPDVRRLGMTSSFPKVFQQRRLGCLEPVSLRPSFAVSRVGRITTSL